MALVSRFGAKKSCRKTVGRRGAYLVLFALSMTLFLGFLALIHDLALINYGWRRCQNIADAPNGDSLVLGPLWGVALGRRSCSRRARRER